MDILEQDGLPVRLCWHHENQLREQSVKGLEDIAKQNVANWLLERVRLHFLFESNHQLSLPELCWWALMHDVYDLLPESVDRFSMKLSSEHIKPGIKKESQIVWESSPRELINRHFDKLKPILTISVDPEPPAGFMLRPKLTRWISENYTRWIKSQDCVGGCGRNADNPHHIIDYGFGGTGIKPHDIFTIPMCRFCHQKLHQNVSIWEGENGSQLQHLVRTLNRAFGLGAIVTANRRGQKS